MEIKLAEGPKEWDVLVEQSPHGTLFHTWDWLKIVEKHIDSKFYPIMLYKGTNLVGIYPIFLRKKAFVRFAFSPPPKAYLLYLGPVIKEYENMKQDKKESTMIQIQKEVDRFLFSELKCNYVRIRSSPGLFDSRPLRWAGYEIMPHYTYRIDLIKGVKNVWEQFDRKLRVDINRAKREGITVEEGNNKDIDFIHYSLSRRYIEQDLTPSDHRKFLLDLYNKFFPTNMRIFIAKYEGESVGGTIFLCYKDIMYLWVGVPKSELKGISPNDMVQWEAINWACENGCRYYEEMDAGDDIRLRHFKSKYNPELAIWYTGKKYSSYIYKVLENIKNII